jgi:small-conductance mechanosensitive channel
MDKRLLLRIGCRGDVRFFWSICLIIISLACCLAFTQAYSFLSSEKATQPKFIAKRKADVKSQLQELEKANMPKEERAKAQDVLSKFVLVLTAIEEATKRRQTYTELINNLPKRLEETAEERKRLEAQQPRHFSTVNEALRDEYEKRRDKTLAEIEKLNSETARGGVRLVHITEALEQRSLNLDKFEKELLQDQGNTGEDDERDTLLSTRERLAAQAQNERVEIEALKAERTWLTKREVLHDALLNVARLRLKHIERDLDTIQQVQAQNIIEEYKTLGIQAKRLEEALLHTDDLVEKRRFAVQRETILIRQLTADYRQQLNQLNDQLQVHEARNAKMKRETEHLMSLVEKYTKGEQVAQRLLITFKRLRRERQRYSRDPVEVFKMQIHGMASPEDPLQQFKERESALTEALFALEDRLYKFDRTIDGRLAEMRIVLSAVEPAQRDKAIAEVHKDLEAQKTALREQQQVLTELNTKVSHLVSLYNEYVRMLDETYNLILNKLFLFRDGEPLSLIMLPSILESIDKTSQRLNEFLQLRFLQLWTDYLQTFPWRFLSGLLLAAGLGFAWWVRRRLYRLATTMLVISARQHDSLGLFAVILLVLQAAIWPLCMALLAWLYMTFISRSINLTDLDLALVRGCYISALILWAGLCSRAICAPRVGMYRFWHLRPEMSHSLHRAVILGCYAALIFLVPRQIVVTIAEEAGGETLARLLFLLFQSVLFMLMVIVGRRSGPFMATALARSREQQGFLWNIWPFIHLACLGGLVGIMSLEVMGYRHAAQFIWMHILESLSVVLALRLFLLVLMIRWIQQLVDTVFSAGSTSRQTDPEHELVDSDGNQRTDAVLRAVCYVFLVIVGTAFILEIWGVSVARLIMAPFAMQMLPRLAIILITVGIALFVAKISNLLAEYWLQQEPVTHESMNTSNRKLRTLTPLFLNLLKVVAGFSAILIILEQFGVATGPLLTGVGIIGVAIGFASQSLVKDIINGLFILFEDSLSVGDLVTLHNLRGVVEKITLRAVTIRDPQGISHLVPNSTIEVVSNETKDFSCYLLDMQVDGDEDIDIVLDVLRKIHEDMRLDPDYAEDLLAPADMVGLERFEGDVVVVRIRLLTRPKRHLDIGREFNRRIKSAFDQRGIHLPSPGYKVALKMQDNTELQF